MRRFVIDVSTCCAVLLAVFSASAAVSQPPQKDTITLRIGVVPFDDPTAPPSPSAPSKDKYLRDYFLNVRAQTQRSARFVIHLQPVQGNYYQILEWLREGLIDGAVVSALSTYLLTHDPALATYPVIEFRRNDPIVDANQAPAFVLAQQNGESLAHPNALLQQCFDSIVQSLRDPSRRQDCELLLVNHLSTTGFLYPLLSAGQYVADKSLPLDEQQAFWQRLMEWTHFTMWQGMKDRKPEGLTRFSLSYFNKEAFQEPLALRHSPRTVNDVLLLALKRENPSPPPANNQDRRVAIGSEKAGAVIKEVLDTPDDVWFRAADAVAPVSDGGYIGVAKWDENKRQLVAGAIEAVFKTPADTTPPTAAQQLFSDWYGRHAYTFTLDELVGLLINDQVLRSNWCAAIVLPGGGVRATYQAAILDYLYGREIENRKPPLTNGGPDCDVAPVFTADHRRLQIATVAGTSGGAELGALVTHRTTAKAWPLRSLWIEDGKAKTSVSDFFTLFSVLRWASILFAIVIFAVIAAMYLATDDRVRDQVPVWYTASLSVVIGIAPIVIWWICFRDASYYPRWEPLALLVLILLVHFVHSVFAPGGATSVPPWWAGILVSAFGVATCIGLIVFYERLAARNYFDSWDDKLRLGAGLWVVGASLSVACVILGIVGVALSQGICPDAKRARTYAWSAAAVICLLAFIYDLFLCGRDTGVVTELEMTPEYWIWVFFCSLIASIVTIEILANVPAHHDPPLLAGLRFFVTPSGTRPLPYSPAVTLIGWGALSIATYFIFIAPALYPPQQGRKTFERALLDTTARRFPAMDQKDLVPLIVSMTAFGGKFQGTRTEPGDYYAYSTEWSSYFHPSDPSRAVPVQPDQFHDAIFASGSPFPFYPAAKVPFRKRFGLFVDGGYAHRVPIDAALLAGAKQILIVENVAYHDLAPQDPGSRLGPLMQNMPKAFSFLFDRSQTVDVERSKTALVGAIYPDWKERDPFLMDFRGAVISRLADVARADEARYRVGHILSWGQPELRADTR